MNYVDLDIKIFEYLDKYFVLDISTSQVIEVDNSFYNWISEYVVDKDFDKTRSTCIEKYGEEKTDEIIRNFKFLIDEKHLNSKKSGSDIPFKETKSDGVHTLLLMVAHTCNMACSYCYADEGTYGTEKKLMDFEVAKKAIDLFVEKSKNINKIKLSFFGGEPFLNFGLIKKCVEYITNDSVRKDKKVTFTITTNGTILNDDQLDFLNKHKFSITLTIDGFKEMHNNHRVLKDGTGTFDLIKNNLLKLKNGDCRVIPQTILSPEYSERFYEIIENYKKWGFRHISLGERFDTSPEEERQKWSKHSRENYYHILKKFTLKIVTDIKNKRNDTCISMQIVRTMIGIDQQERNYYNCSSAENNFIVVTPDSDIYPCQMLIGEEEFLLGNLDDNDYKEIDVENVENTTCKECWLRYFCSGGCFALGYYVNKNKNERVINEICKKNEEYFKLSAYIYSCLSKKEFNDIVKVWDSDE